MLLALTHLCFPRARRHTRKFFDLSYFNPESGEYGAGWNDAWMVSFWIVVFTGLRASIMDYILIPFAKSHNVRTERNQTRFAEQAWLLIYYSVFWTLGMVSPMTRVRVIIANFASTSISIPTTGSILKRCGPIGPIEKSPASQSGTFLFSMPSGCSRYW
jgi:hypothetical protein